MSRWKPQTLLERLTSGITVDGNGCWIWQRSILKAGYGCIRVDGKTRTTHSVAYEMHRGPVPVGLELDHLCRVRACCNPDHLEPVTHKVNVQRGESRDVKAAITHCPHGHEYTPLNTYVHDGRRFCRTCQRARGRDYKARRRAESRAAA